MVMYAIFEGNTLLGYTESPNYVKPHPQGDELGLVSCERDDECGIVYGGKLYNLSGGAELPNAEGEAYMTEIDLGEFLTELSRGLTDAQLALIEIYERLEG
jgi:hypothetical protein